MSKHTPGPWLFVPAGGTQQYGDEGRDMGAFLGASAKRVCDFGDSTHYYPSNGNPPNEADARLIAAAPELLAALRGMVSGFTLLTNSDYPALAKARAAIEKATGEQP